MFNGRQDQDVITVVMKTGETHTGSYMTQAGMHFVATKAGRSDLIGKVEGPFDPEEVERVEVLRSREEVLDERRERSMGDRLPGRDPVTRDDYEYRLDRLARAMAESSGQRFTQFERQFNELADRISLAKSKRQWIIATAYWSLKSNRPPELADLWMADVASPSLIRRPLPKDFDPDPVVRKARERLPDHIADDPLSVPNMLRRLKASGFKAVVSLAGDPPWERAVIQVDLAEGRSGRFNIDGRRTDGQMEWQMKWAGNDSPTGRRHQRIAYRMPEYALLRSLVSERPETVAVTSPHVRPSFR